MSALLRKKFADAAKLVARTGEDAATRWSVARALTPAQRTQSLRRWERAQAQLDLAWDRVLRADLDDALSAGRISATQHKGEVARLDRK